MEQDHAFYLARAKVECEIQQMLANISEENFDETVVYFKSLNFYYSYFLIGEIFRFVSLRPKNNVAYARLIKIIEENNPNTVKIFNKTISKMLMHPFVRLLFDLGCFTFSEMNIDEKYEHFADVIPNYYSFLPDEYKANDDLNQFKVTKEWVYEGYHRNTIEHSIKYDDIDAFQNFTLSDGFDFHAIARKGRFEYFNGALVSPSEIMSTFSHLFNYVELAAYYGSLRCFKFLLLNNCELTNCAFMNAFASGNIELVRLFLQQSFEISEQCGNIACIFFRNEIETWIHELYQFTIIEPSNIRTVINIADRTILSNLLIPLINLEYYDIARLFVSRGCEVNLIQGLDTPLIAAAKTGNIQIVKYLIQHGASACIAASGLPRFPVLLSGSYAVFSFLKEKWFNIGDIPLLTYILEYGDKKTIAEILKMMPRCESHDLIHAAKIGNLDAFKYIYDNHSRFESDFQPTTTTKALISCGGIQITRPRQTKNTTPLQIQNSRKESITIRQTSKINDLLKISLTFALKNGSMKMVDFILSKYGQSLPIDIISIPKGRIQLVEKIFLKYKVPFEPTSCADRYVIEFLRKKGKLTPQIRTSANSFDNLFGLYSHKMFVPESIAGQKYEMTDMLLKFFS